jgi:hypothetical protein
MKRIAFSLLLLLGCSRTSDHPMKDQEPTDANPVQILYDQAWRAHDEVMPKMDEIMKLKRLLQEKISSTPDMVVERKKDLERIISNLDSANREMMNWMHRMHEFNPKQDSLDLETAREYLETEMEKIKKVNELMDEAIEKARAAKGQ